MPLVLERDAWPGWLGESGADPAELLRTASNGTLHLWAVSRAVNSVCNNGPDLIDSIDDPAALPASNEPAGKEPGMKAWHFTTRNSPIDVGVNR